MVSSEGKYPEDTSDVCVCDYLAALAGWGNAGQHSEPV